MDTRTDRGLTRFVVLLAVVATVVLTASAVSVADWTIVVVLAAVFVTSQTLSRPLQVGNLYTDISALVIVASYPLVGSQGAVVVAAAALFNPKMRVGWRARVFNCACSILAALAGGRIYQLIGGPVGLPVLGAFAHTVVAAVAADVVRTLLELVLVLPIARRSGHFAWAEAGRDVARFVVPNLGYGILGTLLAVLWLSGLGPVAAIVAFLPVFTVQHTFLRSADEADAREATLRTLVQAVEIKDPYTGGHSERVGAGAVLLGRALGYSGNRLHTLRYAGVLHDIGKLAVPTPILTKGGALTEDEFAAIRSHPLQGHAVLSDISFLADARAAILHHHERVDGRGYPAGLSGDDIPEQARIVAVADAFDSMTSSRSYRRARTVSEALGELRRCSDTHFDARFVAVFCRAVQETGWQRHATDPGSAVVVGGSGVAADGRAGVGAELGTGSDLGPGAEPGSGPELATGPGAGVHAEGESATDGRAGPVRSDEFVPPVRRGEPEPGVAPYDHDDPTQPVPLVRDRDRDRHL